MYMMQFDELNIHLVINKSESPFLLEGVSHTSSMNDGRWEDGFRQVQQIQMAVCQVP